MLQITYISTARPDLADDVIDGILSASRRNNHYADVTGLLVYDGKRFLQALEGEAADVMATFERIKGDCRHYAVVLLSRREIADREFGPWDMACERVGSVEGTGSVVDIVDALTADVPNASARERFRSFARIRQAA